MLESDIGFSERDNARPCSFVPRFARFPRFASPATLWTPTVVPLKPCARHAGWQAGRNLPNTLNQLNNDAVNPIESRRFHPSILSCRDGPHIEGLRKAPPCRARAAPSWAVRAPPPHSPKTAKTARSSAKLPALRRCNAGAPAIPRPEHHANLNPRVVPPSCRDHEGQASRSSVQERRGFARARSVDTNRKTPCPTAPARLVSHHRLGYVRASWRTLPNNRKPPRKPPCISLGSG